ncbi:MAG: LamG-like jellyroll fold domain-containing protein, partial [Verrucomicrobiales bacterium]
EWQITRAGSLQFGVRRNDQEIDNYTSPIVFKDRIGKWTQLGVSLDHKARTVTHFLDGKPIASHPLRSAMRPFIGRAQIGNWDPPRKDNSYPVRNIHGRIDEVLVYSRALDADTIQELYQVGRP